MAFTIPNAASASFAAQAVMDTVDLMAVAAQQTSGVLPSILDGLSALSISPQVKADMTMVVQNSGQSQSHLTTALTNGQTGVVSIAVAALKQAVTNGDSIILSGVNGRQTVTAGANAIVGATSITTTSFTASFAYPITTTTVVDQAWDVGYVIFNGTINKVTPATLTVTTASTNDRRDIVVWTSGTGFQVIAGTPCSVGNWLGTTASAPPVKPAIPANSVLIAEVYVEGTSATGTTSVVAANLVDKSCLQGSGIVLMTNANTSSGTTFGAALTIIDAATGTGNLRQTFDHLGNPIDAVGRTGGESVFGDMVRASGAGTSGPFITLDGTVVPATLDFPDGTRIWSNGISPYLGITSTVAISVGDLYLNTAAGVWYVATVGGVSPTWVALSAQSMRDQFQAFAPFGPAIESVPRWSINTATATRTTAILMMSAISLTADTVINDLGWMVGSTGATGPTHQWLALYDQNRVMLAQTADQTSTAITSGAMTSWAIAKVTGGVSQSTYTTLYTGLFYIGVLVTTTGAQPTFGGYATNTAATTPQPILCGASDTGLSTPSTFPHTATAITAGANIPYVFCY